MQIILYDKIDFISIILKLEIHKRHWYPIGTFKVEEQVFDTQSDTGNYLITERYHILNINPYNIVIRTPDTLSNDQTAMINIITFIHLKLWRI